MEQENQRHIQDFEPVDPGVLTMLPEGLIRRNLVVPLRLKDGRLLVAVPKSRNIIKPEGLQLVAGCPVEILPVSVEEISAFIAAHFSILPPVVSPKAAEPSETQEREQPHGPEVEEEAEDVEEEDPEEEESQVSGEAESVPAEPEAHASIEPQVKNRIDTPVVPQPTHDPAQYLVKPTITSSDPLIKFVVSAIQNRAREATLEIKGEHAQVRHRIRGTLIVPEEKKEFPKSQALNVVASVLKKGETRELKGVEWTYWQDVFHAGKEDHFGDVVLTRTPEVTLLTVHLTPFTQSKFDPSGWGMDTDQAKVLEQMLSRKQGVILVCGPEGDGIDQTFYGCVRYLMAKDKHVVTVENRVHEWISGIDQFAIPNDPIFYSEILRVTLFHRSDVMGVRPLERKEDFETCFKSALKGPFILGQAHSKDSANLIYQLQGAGVEPTLMGVALIGIVVYQSIRLTCQHCQEKDPAGPSLSRELGVPISMRPESFYRGVGCARCQNTGFDRETNLYEIMDVNDDLRSIIVERNTPEQMRVMLRNKGFRTLRQVALHRAINGQTSLSEVLRTTLK